MCGCFFYFVNLQNTFILVCVSVVHFSRAHSCINVWLLILSFDAIFHAFDMWTHFTLLKVSLNIWETINKIFFISIWMKWSITRFIYSSIGLFNCQIHRIYNNSSIYHERCRTEVKSDRSKLLMNNSIARKSTTTKTIRKFPMFEKLRNESNYSNDEKHLIEPCFGNPRLGSNMFLKLLIFFCSSLYSFHSIPASLENYSKNYIYKWIDNNSKRFFFSPFSLISFAPNMDHENCWPVCVVLFLFSQ